MGAPDGLKRTARSVLIRHFMFCRPKHLIFWRFDQPIPVSKRGWIACNQNATISDPALANPIYLVT